jgi:hypothetical protein
LYENDIVALNNIRKGSFMVKGFNAVAGSIELPHGEGILTVYIHRDTPLHTPPPGFADEWTIGSSDIYHCGKLRRTVLSPQKTALFCQSCGLRLAIPPTINTFGQLRTYLQR